MDIVLDNLRQAEEIIDDITPLKNLLELSFPAEQGDEDMPSCGAESS